MKAGSLPHTLRPSQNSNFGKFRQLPCAVDVDLSPLLSYLTRSIGFAFSLTRVEPFRIALRWKMLFWSHLLNRPLDNSSLP